MELPSHRAEMQSHAVGIRMTWKCLFYGCSNSTATASQRRQSHIKLAKLFPTSTLCLLDRAAADL